ncbi:MAG: SDR family oxidoreductase [FCB group bacterium]|nr:SDR family oxidoreductase [FCB group bacterium]
MLLRDANFLVTGSGGLLGRRVVSVMQNAGVEQARLFCHYHQLDPRDLSPRTIVGDLGDLDHIKEFTERISPDIVINCAAMADVDLCQREPQLSVQTNVRAVELLLQSFPRAVFVQVSTDYVFPDSPVPPKPDVPPAPMNTYGEHKLEAEKAVLGASASNLVIRTNTMFDGGDKRSFFRFVYEALRKGEAVPCLTDQFSNPLSAESAAGLICDLIERNARGIYHIGGGDHVSRYELAERISHCFSLPQELIRPIVSADIPRPAPRPLRAGLDCRETEKFLQRPLPQLDEDLTRLRAEMEY